MRLAAYAGASTALAGAVLVRAFTERPNFYSAAVYLGQSSACNLILMNFLLLSAGSTVFGLQRLLYGPLRPIEIEQLWDKGWYAVTETALAMTTFRDEVGGWFFILFMSLLAGKVWNWIGDGRIEILEQQPPTNPRLFHARLIASLLVSELFDLCMLRYCIHTLQEQPRPGMMVMFAFEFAVLFVSSTSSLARYSISAYEIYVEKQQKKIRNEERREELRVAREAAATEANSSEAAAAAEPDLDDEDVDVPGWQEKGLYVLFLDLITDFLKLILYAVFFTVLLIFSGIPIHMFRDLFITLRSFLKRINDYLKYRNATKDMNSRYSDATAEDLDRDNTCIICREDMHVWQDPAANARPSRNPPDERQRPKKLPCGHILHVGCLRSWLERQQVCPVCRASVLAPGSGQNSSPNQNGGGNPANQQAPGPAGNAQPGQQPGQLPQPPQNHGQRDGGPAAPRPRNFRARTFGFGNFRMTLGIGNHAAPGHNAAQGADGDPHQILDQALDRYRRLMDEARHRRRTEWSHERAGESIQAQLATIERRIVEDIGSLNNVQQQLSTVRALRAQLESLRSLNEHPPPPAPSQPTSSQPGPAQSASSQPAASPLHTTQMQPPIFHNGPAVGGAAVPGLQNGVPAQQTGMPGQQTGVPGQQPGMPGQQNGVPGQHIIIPGEQIGLPGQQIVVPAQPMAANGAPNGMQGPLVPMPGQQMAFPGGVVVFGGLQRVGPDPNHLQPGGGAASPIPQPQQAPVRTLGPADLVDQVPFSSNQATPPTTTNSSSSIFGSGSFPRPQSTPSTLPRRLPRAPGISRSASVNLPAIPNVPLPTWGSAETSTTEPASAAQVANSQSGEQVNGNALTSKGNASESAGEETVAASSDEVDKGKSTEVLVEDAAADDAGPADT